MGEKKIGVDVVFIASVDELTFTLEIASACPNRG